MATPAKGTLRVKCQGPGCGKTFHAKRADQKFCSATCRSRSRRRGSQEVDSDLVRAVKAELRKAGKLGSVHGQIAVKVAKQLDAAGPAQTASLSRELDRLRALVLGPDKPPPAASVEAEPEPDDEVTQARRARDAKLAALREAAD